MRARTLTLTLTLRTAKRLGSRAAVLDDARPGACAPAGRHIIMKLSTTAQPWLTVGLAFLFIALMGPNKLPRRERRLLAASPATRRRIWRRLVSNTRLRLQQRLRRYLSVAGRRPAMRVELELLLTRRVRMRAGLMAVHRRNATSDRLAVSCRWREQGKRRKRAGGAQHYTYESERATTGKRVLRLMSEINFNESTVIRTVPIQFDCHTSLSLAPYLVTPTG
jgi:hypothetical protein